MKLRHIVVAAVALAVAFSASAAMQKEKMMKGKMKGKAKAAVVRTVNLNTADVKGLQACRSINAKTAQAIVDYRTTNGNFATADDVCKVDAAKALCDKKGMLKKRLAKKLVIA